MSNNEFPSVQTVNEKIEQLELDIQRLNSIVNGTGTDTIQTDGPLVPSVAKLFADIELTAPSGASTAGRIKPEPGSAMVSIGQSLRRGKGPVNGIPPSIDSRTKAYNRLTSTIVSSTFGAAPYDVGVVNPGQITASTLSSLTRTPWCDIPNWQGGTPIEAWTEPARGNGTFQTYENMWERLTTDVPAALALLGLTKVALIGISHGESNNASKVDFYYEELKYLMSRIREQSWFEEGYTKFVLNGMAGGSQFFRGVYDISGTTITRISGDDFTKAVVGRRFNLSGSSTSDGEYEFASVAADFQSVTVTETMGSENSVEIFLEVPKREHGQILNKQETNFRELAGEYVDVSYNPSEYMTTYDGLHADAKSTLTMAEGEASQFLVQGAANYNRTCTKTLVQNNASYNIHTNGTSGVKFNYVQDFLDYFHEYVTVAANAKVLAELVSGVHVAHQTLRVDSLQAKQLILRGASLNSNVSGLTQASNSMPLTSDLNADETLALSELKSIFGTTIECDGGQGLVLPSVRFEALEQILFDGTNCPGDGIVLGDVSGDIDGASLKINKCWSHGFGKSGLIGTYGSTLNAAGTMINPLFGSSYNRDGVTLRSGLYDLRGAQITRNGRFGVLAADDFIRIKLDDAHSEFNNHDAAAGNGEDIALTAAVADSFVYIKGAVYGTLNTGTGGSTTNTFTSRKSIIQT